MFFLAGVGEEGDLDEGGRGGEEGELGLGPAGILFDLFPEVEILFELFLLIGVLLIEYDGVVLIFLGVQELTNELPVHRLSALPIPNALLAGTPAPPSSNTPAPHAPHRECHGRATTEASAGLFRGS